MEYFEVAIIGGGAAGLACAAMLAKENFNGVTLIERGERLGKKLSATGNGQGNVTNADMNISHYYSDDLGKIERLISSFDNEAVVRFLSSLGGLFGADEKGRVYPASRQASSVTDLLRNYIVKRGVEVKTDFFASDISFSNGFFIINGEISSRKVIMCGGGKAQKSFGSDGNMYSLAKKFGHTVTPLYPSLVQLKTDTEHIKTLRGIRCDVALSAIADGRVIASSKGDVIFTEYGISGNAVFALSPKIADLKGCSLSISFLPCFKDGEILSAIKNRLALGVERGELLGGILNNQIGRAVMKRVNGASPEEILYSLRNFTLLFKGTLGFDYAQVTKGGIPLKETDEGLQSLKREGLYFCGEILNVDGDCGGYNLQWAFSSAYAAAKAIVCGGREK